MEALTGRLRRPFLVAALVLAALTVALEVGATGVLRAFGAPAEELLGVLDRTATQLTLTVPDPAAAARFAEQSRPPGLAVPYLALFDSLLLLAIALMVAGLLVPDRLLGRASGVVTLVVALLVLLGGVLLALLALFALTLMVSLLVAAPFGTAVYMAVYGSFARGAAAAVLGSLLALKVGALACLVLAQPRFLRSKGLLFLFAGSLGLTVVVAFLHGLVPRPLVSITDAIGGIVVAVVAVVWSLVVLVSSLFAVAKAVKAAA